jgi:hypothetical protein
VTQAINQVNEEIQNIAANHNNVINCDINAFFAGVLSQADTNGFLSVEGELITVIEEGDEPHHLRLNDSFGHAGSVLSGLLANHFIAALNEFDLDIAPFTEAEILANAGIATPPQAIINSFGSSSSTIFPGNFVTLGWQTQGLYCATINNEVETISVPLNGQLSLMPTQNTTYTLNGIDTNKRAIYDQQTVQVISPSSFIYLPILLRN